MAILHLHRREITLLQRARVHVEDGRVVYSQAGMNGISDEEELVRRWNIPTLNSSILLLGQGCSVTQGAMRRFHDDEVMVAFSFTCRTQDDWCPRVFRIEDWASECPRRQCIPCKR